MNNIALPHQPDFLSPIHGKDTPCSEDKQNRFINNNPCLFENDAVLLTRLAIILTAQNLMHQHNHSGSFWKRSNDLQNRQWPFRLARFLRARMRRLGSRIVELADEPRAFQAWTQGWDIEHFIRLTRWRDQGFRPRVIYDIGAHSGAWAEMCQVLFGPDECVLFEPQPDLQIEAGKRQRRLGARWRILPFGLGARNEKQTLYVTENGAASSMLAPVQGSVPKDWGTAAVAQKEVEVLSLDSAFAQHQLPRPDLVKIDVQGYEGQVIDGGRGVLAQAERLIVEVSLRPIYQGQALLPAILQILSQCGFELEDMNEACREWSGQLWQTDLWMKRTRLS